MATGGTAATGVSYRRATVPPWHRRSTCRTRWTASTRSEPGRRRRCRCTRPPSWWSTWRPPAARPTAAASPRSARSRCAAASSWASSPRWSTRAQPIPPFITVLTGITAGDGGCPRRRSRRCCRLPGVPARRGAGGPQRPVRRGLPQGRLRPARLPLAQAPGARHGGAGPAGADRATRCPTASSARWRAYFRTATQPTHRALDDARATVDVLHALIGRLGGHKVHTLGDAIEFAKAVTPDPAAQAAPGRGAARRAGRLHLPRPPTTARSTSAPPVDIATRVRSYFTAAEKRARISEMLAAAERVEAVECAHSLEAEVRELRLIAAHKPPYNRRSKYPGAGGLAQAHRRGRTRGCRWCAQLARRRRRLPRARSPPGGPPSWPRPASTRRCRCASARTGSRCAPPRRPARWPSWAGARRPASTGSPPRSTTRAPPAPFRAATARRPAAGGRARCWPASTGSPARQRYEEAAAVRARLAALLRAAVRMQRLAALTAHRRAGRRPAGRRRAAGSWRWCGTAGWPRPAPRRRGVHPRPTLDALLATAETVLPGPGPDPVRHARRRPSGSWPGWSGRRPGWCECPAGWASPGRRRGPLRVTCSREGRESAASGDRGLSTDRS